VARLTSANSYQSFRGGWFRSRKNVLLTRVAVRTWSGIYVLASFLSRILGRSVLRFRHHWDGYPSYRERSFLPFGEPDAILAPQLQDMRVRIHENTALIGLHPDGTGTSERTLKL
jgi:hypothetical protein